MLNLVIIGIVCAVSAPSEKTALIGLKSYKSNALRHFGEEDKLFLPQLNNVDVSNFSDCSKQKITNRTNSLFYKYIIKQYKNKKNSFCSFKENFLQRKKKNNSLNINFIFKKRNLLWTDKNSKEVKISVTKPLLINKRNNNSKRNFNRNFRQAANKKFTSLKKVKLRRRKRNSQEKYLDKVKMDEDVDINKRIKKLVKQVALENLRQQKNNKLNGKNKIIISSTGCDITTKLPKQIQKSFSFFNKIKNLFRLTQEFFNLKKNKRETHVASVPVNVVSINNNDIVTNTKSHIHSYDIVNAFKRATRFSKNSFRNIMPKIIHEDAISRYKNNLFDIPNTYNIHSNLFRSLFHFQSKRKFIPKSRRKKRANSKVKVKKYKLQNKYKNWPLLYSFIPKHNTEQSNYNIRLRRNDAITSDSYKYISRNKEQSTSELNFFSLNDFKVSTDIIQNYDKKVEDTTKQTVGVISTPDYNEKFKISDHTFEKLSLFSDLNDTERQDSAKNINLDGIAKKHNLFAKLSLLNPSLFQFKKQLKFDSQLNENLTFNRFLKIRHALRSYLIHNNVLKPEKSIFKYKRKKRCGRCNSMPHKCWRSAPLLCIPYIRKGQDELLRYVIKTLQKMLGKPFPQKVDIFEKTKFKPCFKKHPKHTCKDIMPNDEESEYETTPSPCSPEPCFDPFLSGPPVLNGSCSTNSPLCPTTLYSTTSRSTSCPTTPYSTALSFKTTTSFSPMLCSTTATPSLTTPKFCPTTPCPTTPSPTTPCPTTPSPTTPCSTTSYSATSYTTTPYPTTSFTTTPCPTTSFTTTPYPKTSFTTTPYSTTSFTTKPCPTAHYAIALCPTTPVPYLTTPKPCFTTQRPCSTISCLYSNFFCAATAKSSSTIPYSITEISSTPSCFFSFSDLNHIPQTTMYHLNRVIEEKSTVVSCSPATSFTITPNCRLETIISKNPTPVPVVIASFRNPTRQISKVTVKSSMRMLPSTPNPVHFSLPVSTMKAYSWHLSNPPFEQAEYFSFKAVPFTVISGFPPTLSQYSQTIPQTAVKGHAFNRRSKMISDHNEIAYPIRNANLEDTTAQHSFMPSYEHEVQNKEKSKNSQIEENIMKLPFSGNFWKSVKTKFNEKKGKKMSKFSKNFNRGDLYFTERNIQSGYGQDRNYKNYIPRNLKIRHHKGTNFNFKPKKNFLLARNYEFFEKYPFMKSSEKNNLKHNNFPTKPRSFSKNVNNKIKNSKCVSCLTRRQKRESKYHSSFKNSKEYTNYLYDSNYYDKYPESSFKSDSKIKKIISPKISDKVFMYDSHWTPPSFALFSELAMAVTQSENITYSATKNSEDTRLISEENSVNLSSSTENNDANNRKNNLMKGKSTVPNIFLFTDFFTETSVNNSFCVSPKTIAFNTTKFSLAISTTPLTTETTVFDKTKITPISSKSSHYQTKEACLSDLGKLKKELKSNQELDTGEEDQIPTTLKFASIVKGPKKLLAKPPKIYSKVYPDSLPNEIGSNEIISTQSLPLSSFIPKIDEKTTSMQSNLASDIRIKLLEVCESYLEVIKLIRIQNQSLEEKLDTDLSRYCENVISQSFNLPSDCNFKSKPSELFNQTVSPISTLSTFIVTSENPSKNLSTFISEVTLKHNDVARIFPHKIIIDMLNSPVFKRELIEKTDKAKLHSKSNNLKEIHQKKIRKSKLSYIKDKPQLRKKNKYCLAFNKISNFDGKNRKRFRRKEDIDEKLLKKGISEEQLQLLKLLRKRKKALLSWLFNSKEDQMKSDGVQETKNLNDDEYIAPNSGYLKASGTIAFKKANKSTEATTNEAAFVNKSSFPIYAEQYGYDKGGELRKVEVFWRKVDEKTHEKQIFKNVSVLALFLTSSNPPNVKNEEMKLVGNNKYESGKMSEIQLKSENKADFADLFDKTHSTVAPVEKESISSSDKNNTYIVINKPDLSSIVGSPPNISTTVHPNMTHKMSHKLGAAKDLFQEYTIEFLNYAVYILPIMFTLLFLFCCMCCFLHILKTRKKKKKKKKKKNQYSTEDESETTEESGRDIKKRKNKHKKQSKNIPNIENLDQKKSKTFWNVLKLHSSKPSSELGLNTTSTEKKKNFLRFLKGKKDESKAEEFSSTQYTPLQELEEHSKKYPTFEEKNKQAHESDDQTVTMTQDSEIKKKDEKQKTDEQSEAAERRELIALLEELKKIELENTGEKKEKKSVHVQYMTQEEESVFKSPHNPSSYQFRKYFGYPENYMYNKQFHEFDATAVENYELYDDAGELVELLPCHCKYYSKKNDCVEHSDFRINQEGKCERFFKMFRNCGINQHNLLKEIHFTRNERTDRNDIFNKYRYISDGSRNKLLTRDQKNAEAKVNLTDEMFNKMPPFTLLSKKKNDLVEEMENYKQLNKKKYVRLKDDGVLCRL